MKDFAALVTSLAWPLVALVAMLTFRSSLKDVADSFAMRVRTARSVKFGKFSMEGLAQVQEQVEAVKGQVASMAAQQGVMADKVFAPQSRGSVVPEALRKLAEEYMTVEIPDHRERVKRKNELARQMADIVLSQGIPYAEILKANDEGLLMAAVSAIAIHQQEGDLTTLLAAANKATRLHVRYRTVVAMIAYMAKRAVPVRAIPRIRKALGKMGKGADAPLEKIIAQAFAALDDIEAGGAPAPLM